MQIENTRVIHPFFKAAIDRVYQKPNKTTFIMDGSVGLGKSTNFTFDAPYDVAQHVKPKTEKGVQVRRSTWVVARESENSAVNTLYEIFENSRFPPEILYSKKESPVKKTGINPTKVTIEHELPDGTHLHMTLECYGFSDERLLDRLKSRSWLGAIVPEMQTMSFQVIDWLVERCGGRSSPGMIVQKEIDGKLYTLSGADPLTMVFADANIKPRPHSMYDRLYDNDDLEKSEYELITPPAPVIPLKLSDHPRLAESYPVTKFEGQETVWIPNKESYWMTAHFEEALLDENGIQVMDGDKPQTIPWSGYNYWLKKVFREEDYVRRMILGRPATLGGGASIYKNFDKNVCVTNEDYRAGVQVYMGLDPGIAAGWIFFQVFEGRRINVFKEITFDPEDGADGRNQIENYVLPYIEENLNKAQVIAIGDPYALVKTSKGDGEAVILKEYGIKVKTCLVPNQNTDARIACLGHFITTGNFTIHPRCKLAIAGLSGGYQRKVTRAGVISRNVDKDNPYSHIIEALQYPAVNVYHQLRKKDAGKNTRGIAKLVSR